MGVSINVLMRLKKLTLMGILCAVVALSTESCEFQFGLYPEALQDGGCSNKYIVCEFGRANIAQCAPGLAYDPRSHRCNWPDEMLDLNCEPKSKWPFLLDIFHRIRFLHTSCPYHPSPS